MLDLNQINLATEEDKRYQIDRWARLFKATTWDELNGDETVRAQCRAREDYEYRQKMMQHKMAELTSDNRALQAENDTLQSEIGKLRSLLAEHGISEPQ